MLVFLFVALWFILRGDLFYILPCVILFLCFSVLLALRLPCLENRELVIVLFVRLFDLRLFGFVCFLFLMVFGKGCGLWLWHSLDFSLILLFLLSLRRSLWHENFKKTSTITDKTVFDKEQCLLYIKCIRFVCKNMYNSVTDFTLVNFHFLIDRVFLSKTVAYPVFNIRRLSWL